MMASGSRVAVSWGFPLLVGGFLAVFYLLTIPGAIAPHISDGRSMYLVTRALVDRHDVAIIPNSPSEVISAPGWKPVPLPTGACATEINVDGIGEHPGGPYFSKYGIGQPVAAAPLYLLGTLAARLAPSIDRAEIAAFVTSAFPALVTALTAALLCAAALRLGWSRRVGLALALLFGVATPAWVYTTSFFSEPLITLCVFGALATTLWPEGTASWRAALLTGCWLGAATLTRLDSVFYIPAFAVYLLCLAPRVQWTRLVAALAAPVTLSLALIGWYNVARFGSPFRTGYDIVGDYHDRHPPHSLQALWEGIYGPLFSPGKGLFLYAPILLLVFVALPRFGRGRIGAAWLVVALCAIDVLAHANTLIVWLGGWAWGPRFLIPIIPVMLLPVGALLQESSVMRPIAWVLGLGGVVLQVPAVLLDRGAYITHLRDTVAGGCIWTAEDLYKWHPQYSPLIGQWQRLLDSGTYAAQASYFLTPAGRMSHTAQGISAGRLVPAPLPWWSLLSAQGVPWPLLAIVAMVIGGLALILLLLAHRATGQSAQPLSTLPYRAPQPHVVVKL